MGNPTYYLLAPNRKGVPSGPYSVDRIRVMIRERRISTAYWAAPAGGEWRRLDDVMKEHPRFDFRTRVFPKVAVFCRSDVLKAAGTIGLVILAIAGASMPTPVSVRPGIPRSPAPTRPTSPSSAPETTTASDEDRRALAVLTALEALARQAPPPQTTQRFRDLNRYNGTVDHPCQQCGARGTIRTPSGYVTTCPLCGGTGKTTSDAGLNQPYDPLRGY